MKRALLVVLVLGSACIQNHKDLHRTLAESERILADEQMRAE